MKFLSRDMGIVHSDFHPDALNTVNQLFYGSSADIDWYSEEAGVADLYVSFEPFLQGFAAWLKKQDVSKKPMRVRELCAGPRAGKKWETIAPAYLELTDFQREPRLNLFDDFETLPQEMRFDVMFVSYGFDSVWLPEDVSLEFKKGEWFRKLFRVTQTKALPLRPKLQDLKRAFRLEERDEEIPDIRSLAYGKEIAEYYSGLRWVQPNFPGGLIAKVLQAFERQLNPNGLFISLESAVPDKQTWRTLETMSASYGTTGSVALYKDQDYGIAKFILERKGFQVQIIPVKKLTDPFVSEYSKHAEGYQEAYESLLDSQYMMVVKKA